MTNRDLPGSYDGWERQARASADDERYRYITSSAGSGETARANVDSFRRWKIVPRVLRETDRRSCAVSLFGHNSAAPIILAPVRGLGYIHKDGDLAVARVAAEVGIPLVVSTFATTPIEKIAQAMGSGMKWFQLYPGKDKEVMKSLVQRAETSGYSAIVVTVDKAESYPHYQGPRRHEFDRHGYEVYFSDPAFRARLGGTPESRPEAATKLWKEIRLAQGLSLDDLHAIFEWTRLPVVVKGIMRPDDAELAIGEGAAGIVVSNHGGRSLDGEMASLDALVEVRKVAKEGFPVFMDGGVRSGTDVFKALALGADAVLIGKAYLLALAAAGGDGVRKVLRDLIAEFDAAMGICGALNVDGIDLSMVTES
jgi:isopentenyl diphosphate isomerase/L-lactate dehydrogenase-like FMN-dependent dehydrogenase